MEKKMVPILAKQAVQIKCGFENAGITGNYELAYALGILTAAAQIEKVNDFKSVKELKEKVTSQTSTFTSEDNRMLKMLDMIKNYEPSGAFDEQMIELYDMGYKDKKL